MTTTTRIKVVGQYDENQAEQLLTSIEKARAYFDTLRNEAIREGRMIREDIMNYEFVSYDTVWCKNYITEFALGFVGDERTFARVPHNWCAAAWLHYVDSHPRTEKQQNAPLPVKASPGEPIPVLTTTGLPDHVVTNQAALIALMMSASTQSPGSLVSHYNEDVSIMFECIGGDGSIEVNANDGQMHYFDDIMELHVWLHKNYPLLSDDAVDFRNKAVKVRLPSRGEELVFRREIANAFPLSNILPNLFELPKSFGHLTVTELSDSYGEKVVVFCEGTGFGKEDLIVTYKGGVYCKMESVEHAYYWLWKNDVSMQAL